MKSKSSTMQCSINIVTLVIINLHKLFQVCCIENDNRMKLSKKAILFVPGSSSSDNSLQWLHSLLWEQSSEKAEDIMGGRVIYEGNRWRKTPRKTLFWTISKAESYKQKKRQERIKYNWQRSSNSCGWKSSLCGKWKAEGSDHQVFPL